MRLQYILLILRASLTRSTLNLLGNRRQNHYVRKLFGTHKVQYEIANLLLSLQLVITYQQNKERH